MLLCQRPTLIFATPFTCFKCQILHCKEFGSFGLTDTGKKLSKQTADYLQRLKKPPISI